MGIKLVAVAPAPAIKYEYVFMTRLEIEQVREKNSHKSPVYNVVIEYRLYGVDADGVRHFHPEHKEMYLKDYLILATQKAATGDLDMIKAMLSIERAVASIIEDQTGIATEIVT